VSSAALVYKPVNEFLLPRYQINCMCKLIELFVLIHGIKYSELAGMLQKVDQCLFVPNVCGAKRVTGKVSQEFILSVTDRLEVVDKFCYWETCWVRPVEQKKRVKCAWGKFQELAPILTTRGASLKLKGKMYRACIQRVMVYGSETWAMKVTDMRSLERTENTMVRWMCGGMTLRDRRRYVELRYRLGIECVAEVVRSGRLRLFGM
jgi:hypothetical protein